MTLAPIGRLESPAPSIGKSLKHTGLGWNRTRSALVATRLFWTTSRLRMRHTIRALIGGVGTITRNSGFGPVAGARTTEPVIEKSLIGLYQRARVYPIRCRCGGRKAASPANRSRLRTAARNVSTKNLFLTAKRVVGVLWL
jgi:hypothetical protein